MSRALNLQLFSNGVRYGLSSIVFFFFSSRSNSTNGAADGAQSSTPQSFGAGSAIKDSRPDFHQLLKRRVLI